MVMKARIFASAEYHTIESDLCQMHKVPDEFDGIDDEWADIKSRFMRRIGREFLLSRADKAGDFEFPDWHSNIRMLWIYLYAARLFTPRLPEAIAYALEPYGELWFAQCECYADEEQRPHHDIGYFIYQNGLFLVLQSEEWPEYLGKMELEILGTASSARMKRE